MKKEKVTQLKIQESHGEAVVIDEKINKKNNRALKNKKAKSEKMLNKQEKKVKAQLKKEQKIQKKQQEKLEKEKYKINYFKKLEILKKINKERKEKEKQEAIEYEKSISSIYKKRKIAPWLRIDNAGTIYPPAKRRHWNFVYRITAVTINKVNYEVLVKAVEEILPRFPSFNVCLKKGLFWNYFERAPRKLQVIKDTDFPCTPFDLSDTNANLIRVIYDDYKIAFECFHALSDGRGALVFLNALLNKYFILTGEHIEPSDTILNSKHEIVRYHF